MEFLTGDNIPPQTGVVPYLTSFPKNSTDISHPQEINPSSNPEFLQGNCPGEGDKFPHFSNSDQDIHQNLFGRDLEFLARFACDDNNELFDINKFIDHDNGRGVSANDNGSPGLLRKRKNADPEYSDNASFGSFWEAELRCKFFSLLINIVISLMHLPLIRFIPIME